MGGMFLFSLHTALWVAWSEMHASADWTHDPNFYSKWSNLQFISHLNVFWSLFPYWKQNVLEDIMIIYILLQIMIVTASLHNYVTHCSPSEEYLKYGTFRELYLLPSLRDCHYTGSYAYFYFRY
jgi:hypothetical protein